MRDGAERTKRRAKAALRAQARAEADSGESMQDGCCCNDDHGNQDCPWHGGTSREERMLAEHDADEARVVAEAGPWPGGSIGGVPRFNPANIAKVEAGSDVCDRCGIPLGDGHGQCRAAKGQPHTCLECAVLFDPPMIDDKEGFV